MRPSTVRRDPPRAPAEGADDGIEALSILLAATPREERPEEHAVLAYRLGMAYAASPRGDPRENLRKALACYAAAEAVFDARSKPVEHARVLNAAGAARRLLGETEDAERMFRQAAALAALAGQAEERAAALANLGLALAELDRTDEALAALDEAVRGLPPGTPGLERARAAALHNRGLVAAAAGGAAELERALADYAEAAALVSAGTPSWARIRHAAGVALMALAALDRDGRQGRLEDAVAAFTDALSVFGPGSFPFEHAVAKHNLGRAWAELGEELSDELCLRRSLACFEDAVATFDPRLHAVPWRQAFERLAEVERRLASIAPGSTRAEQFAALLARCGRKERRQLVRERLLRVLSLPEPHHALVGLATAVAGQGAEVARTVLAEALSVLMELPSEALRTVLSAVLEAHRGLPAGARESADRALDLAVGDALNGPQRVFVRDFLASEGFVRP